MPLRTAADLANAQRIAEGGVEDPWRFVNGVVPSSGVQAKGTNARTERINRLNHDIRERELAKAREEAEYAAGAEERDKIEAARTVPIRLGEMGQLVKEAEGLHEVLRGKSVEVTRLSDQLSEVKADQLNAEMIYDDPLEAAKVIVFAKEAIPLIQRKLEEARAELVPVEQAIKDNSRQLSTLATDLLRKLREARFEELVHAVEQATAKVCPLRHHIVEEIVRNSQTFEDYSVRTPSHAEPHEWAEVIADLKELAESKPKKANR
jgi:hypothetical protein